MVFATPLAATRPSRAPCASKWLRASVSGRPMSWRSVADHRGGEAGGRVEPGADRGAAERQLADAGSDRVATARCRSRTGAAYPPNSWPSVTGVASIRCVRPLLTTSANSAAFASSDVGEVVERGQQIDSTTAAAAARWIADGNTSLDDWDALTWSFGWTGRPELRGWPASRSPRWRSCSTRCPSRSGRRRSGTGRPSSPRATSRGGAAIASAMSGRARRARR